MTAVDAPTRRWRDMPGAALDRAFDDWSTFWFGATSGAVFVTIRTGLGLIGLLWFASLVPDLNLLFGEQSVAPVPAYGSWEIGIFRWISAETWMGPTVGVGVVASLGLILGRLVRVSAAVAAVGMQSITLEAPIYWNSGDELFRIMIILFAVSAILIGRSSEMPLFGIRSAVGGRQWSDVPQTLLRLFQIQLTVIYVTTFIAKIVGEPWRGGTAAAMALKLHELERFWVPSVFTESLVLANLMTWGTLALEISIPFLIWTKRTRNFAVVAGIFLHLTMEYALEVGVFSYAMWVLYVAFMKPSWVEKKLGRVADFVAKANPLQS